MDVNVDLNNEQNYSNPTGKKIYERNRELINKELDFLLF